MPLLDVHELIHTVDTNDSTSAVSLLLFQAIMFAGVASVDMAYLQTAGYTNRRAARREFFQKTRVSEKRFASLNCKLIECSFCMTLTMKPIASL